MFAHQSHSYAVQAVALWLSFLPAFAILGLLAAAQVDHMRRNGIRLRVVRRRLKAAPSQAILRSVQR